MHPRLLLALLTSAVVTLGVLVVLAFAQPTTVSLEDGVQAKDSPYRAPIRSRVTPTATRPTMRPDPSRSGATVRTDRPSVPV
jgi:hypothetical protein